MIRSSQGCISSQLDRALGGTCVNHNLSTDSSVELERTHRAIFQTQFLSDTCQACVDLTVVDVIGADHCGRRCDR